MMVRKLNRLLERYEKIVLVLAQYTDTVVHRQVSEFFYLEKITEMKLLLILLKSPRPGTEQTVEMIYKKYYCHWRRDARWLSRYINQMRQRTLL